MRMYLSPTFLSNHSVRILDRKLVAYDDTLIRTDRFPYTVETYNNPQKLWLFV